MMEKALHALPDQAIDEVGKQVGLPEEIRAIEQALDGTSRRGARQPRP